jgi:hypothetical protein
MLGRSGCLLVWALVLSAASFVYGQDRQSARISPRLAVESPSVRLPGKRIIHPVRPPISPPRFPGFPQFVRAAGIIFSGTVTRIERRPARLGQSVETVAVTFHIENAIRGATPGRDLTITQWIGLWASGQQYRVGERVLLFLYPNSKLGLTSWVGGPLGHFAIDSAGRIQLAAQHLAVFQRDPVLGGKSRARFSDFALAVRQAREEE